jgi:hypothetical protein
MRFCCIKASEGERTRGVAMELDRCRESSDDEDVTKGA